MEEWKDIEGYEGLYQVSSFGRVRRILDIHVVHGSVVKKPIERILNATDNGCGYLIVGLMSNGKRKNHYVHRLVAGAFCKKKNGCDVVNHIDYNTHNNYSSNLEWCNQSENLLHSVCNKKLFRNCKTNTGHNFITQRKSGMYRITIKNRERQAKTLEEALEIREVMMNEIYNSR